MRRDGVSLLEVLMATAMFAILAAAMYGTLVSSLRGISADRLTETKRFVTQDLLERFCHPYSDLGALFPPGATSASSAPLERLLTTDEALRLTGLPPEATTQARATLRTGGVTGFRIVWHRGVQPGKARGPRALRLDALWCIPALTGTSPGPRVDSFRVFALRGAR